MSEYIKREDALGEVLVASERYRIKQIPAADVAPVVHGKWIEEEYETISAGRNRQIKNIKNTCSVCHKSNGRKKQDYCPNCGARMDGEPNDDT